MYRTEQKAFAKLIDLSGVATRASFTSEENARLTRLSKKTGYVRRMADGRWEVTARGWQAKNAEDAREVELEEQRNNWRLERDADIRRWEALGPEQRIVEARARVGISSRE